MSPASAARLCSCALSLAHPDGDAGALSAFFDRRGQTVQGASFFTAAARIRSRQSCLCRMGNPHAHGRLARRQRRIIGLRHRPAAGTSGLVARMGTQSALVAERGHIVARPSSFQGCAESGARSEVGRAGAVRAASRAEKSGRVPEVSGVHPSGDGLSSAILDAAACCMGTSIARRRGVGEEIPMHQPIDFQLRKWASPISKMKPPLEAAQSRETVSLAAPRQVRAREACAREGVATG